MTILRNNQPDPDLTSRRCAACHALIAPARLAALPTTPWCVACAETRVARLGGNMVWSHKTGPVIEVKPMAKAKRFARLTRRHAYNASLGVDSVVGAMNARDHVGPDEK
jgi:hypothetical protein